MKSFKLFLEQNIELIPSISDANSVRLKQKVRTDVMNNFRKKIKQRKLTGNK